MPKVTLNSPGQNRISINTTGVQTKIRSVAISTTNTGSSGSSNTHLDVVDGGTF